MERCQMMLRNNFFILIGYYIFFMCLFTTCHASAPQVKWLILSSDQADIHYKKRINIFTGHVHIRNEDSTLDGDKVITHQNDRHHFTSVVDYGKPARYETIVDPQKPHLIATADTIKYFPPVHHVILIHHGFAQQGPNTITGPIIHYDTVQRILRSTASQLGQTHIILDNEGSAHVQE